MKPETRILRAAVLVNGLVPAALLGWDALRGQLGVNPVEFVLRTTGLLTLVFLVLGLMVTPLRRLLDWPSIIKVRRMLGLYAMFYAAAHFLAYVGLDQGFDVRALAGELLQRPFIMLGFAAFVLLVPLAVTSTDAWVRRLGGKRWARLHRRVYLVAILGVVHYWMAVKADLRKPLVFALLVGMLLGVRLLWFLQARRKRPGELMRDG
jgi:sulfoxide reductase heme-binding subunit YedZ